MNEQILAAFARYGSPALFAIVAIAAVGLPLPVTLLLIVTGSMVAQGAMDAWSAIAIAAAGSVVGDQLGFAIGRWGSGILFQRLKHLLGNPERLRRLDAKAKAWGSAGIFFSRWLVTPLGPWINLATGASRYSWLRFTIWDVLGETFGAALFIWAGRVFNDRVQEVSSVFGDLTWAIVGILAAAILGWKLLAKRAVETRSV
ncbi:MAG TPA: VTT domain-containing protein [Bryobacteraceae bacterium]|jgi:membrane protein DedA with SNARE-associated domain|nr:VTT domain-containing protein [Bryobacteraceae bacterium]